MAKTREEYVAEQLQYKADAEAKTLVYNDAAQNGDVKASQEADAAIAVAIDGYNRIAELLAFDTCINSENPMVTAVTMLTYQAIVTKDEKSDELPVATRKIVTKEKYLDLKKLHKRVNGGIGADKKWIYMVEQFNMQMTAKRAQELGCKAERLKEINDSYAMSEIAKKINLGKNPCSNTQMLKTLQEIVKAMLGDDYKPTSHDVAFLYSVYAKHGKKALSLACANHNNFRKMIAEVCHRIVTEKAYDVEFKVKK